MTTAEWFAKAQQMIAGYPPEKRKNLPIVTDQPSDQKNAWYGYFVAMGFMPATFRLLIEGQAKAFTLPTAADYWIHFHPLERCAYWYSVQMMREFIRLRNVPVTLGRSKDETVTGAGYLIPKDTYIICPVAIPPSYCDFIDWRALTDRQAGQNGELVIATLIGHGVVELPRRFVSFSRALASQFSGIDGEIKWLDKIVWEAKTERAISENLFVQKAERNHSFNALRGVQGEAAE